MQTNQLTEWPTTRLRKPKDINLLNGAGRMDMDGGKSISRGV
jgi:hypothetical protein